MVQAGKGTDAVIDQLVERFEPGDIIVDGGNANFHDTIEREKRIAPTGIHFVGTGISGGEEGALKGPSIMPGGSAESYETLGPILASIAAVAEGEPCVTHVGTDGAGHFVKMIHNGIEYADMQLIAEAYDLLRTVGGLEPAAIADVFTEWNKGYLESYLIEITAEVLRQVDAETGKPFVDIVLDQAGSQGHRRLDRAERARPGRPRRRHRRGRVRPRRVLQAARSARPCRRSSRPVPTCRRSDSSFADDVSKALYASKVVAYAQGFDAIIAGAEKYGWNINKDKIAKIWRGGCIIRAQFLNRIADAYDENPDIATLLEAPYFADAVARARPPGVASSRPPRSPAFRSPASVPRSRYYDSLAVEASARRARAGPARLLRRAHLQARRQARHVPHAVVRRPHRDRDRRLEPLACASPPGARKVTSRTTGSRSRTSAPSWPGCAPPSACSPAAWCSNSSLRTSGRTSSW